MDDALRLRPGVPALVLAPMDGLTDAPMRAVQGEIGAFTYAVAEFVRVSATVVPKHVFVRDVPELLTGSRTRTGLPVQVQILGGDPGRMAASALVAVEAGARSIDINFGCPAPTVNSHDGGASLLKHPARIREIVRAVRDAVPDPIPVSAKLRLGWDCLEAILENAAMAAEGGADWVTIHARTREQGYRPPAHWAMIRRVVEEVADGGARFPVVANGDIWSLDDLRRCRDVTGCDHFMLGRGAIADPRLSHRAARELGLVPDAPDDAEASPIADWRPYLQRLVAHSELHAPGASRYVVKRLKQWLSMAHRHGDFAHFDAVKRAETVEEMFATLAQPRPAA